MAIIVIIYGNTHTFATGSTVDHIYNTLNLAKSFGYLTYDGIALSQSACIPPDGQYGFVLSVESELSFMELERRKQMQRKLDAVNETYERTTTKVRFKNKHVVECLTSSPKAPINTEEVAADAESDDGSGTARGEGEKTGFSAFGSQTIHHNPRFYPAFKALSIVAKIQSDP